MNMKKLWTSYYGRPLPKGAVRVQISNSRPSWLDKLIEAKELAPVWMKLAWAGQVEVDDPAWRAHYRDQLKHLDEQGVLKAIVEALPDGAFLCCYEKDAETCHRSELARFLMERGYAEVAEWQPEAQSQETAQLKLSL